MVEKLDDGSGYFQFIISDITLEDDDTPEGGTSYYGETLGDLYASGQVVGKSLSEINNELERLGIKPISLDQIWIEEAMES